MARYADQQWLIFDLKRNYGIFYDLNEVKTITMQDHHLRPTNDVNEHMVSEREGYYQQLWGNYFSSTNIKERINLNLHIRHVPKRYWKFLTEKSLISKK
jgi:probable DNA metabolism protein